MVDTSERPIMREQDPSDRIHNFNEVPLGFTHKMALKEAKRCLQCANPRCVEGCPVNINIPQFIKLIKEGRNREAIEAIKEFNILPSICGRVCPQEIQCENSCVLGRKGEPIAIGSLERYVGDWERENQLKACPECKPPNNIKIAIIGSGPAGLTCATDLARVGYSVTIFEAFHKAGGVLTYGIPEFRLPKDIVQDEIATLKMLGVNFRFNAVIGKILTIQDLRNQGYKAFFIGVGAGLPIFLNLPGIGLNNVMTANEILTRTNLMKAYKFPEYDTPVNIGKKVVVIGGGNVAVDSARVALRLGADEVTIAYRRSKLEMPAREAEYHHAVQEGINVQFLTNPVEFIGDNGGDLKEMKVIRMRLGEPDAKGKPKPIPIKGSEFTIETDMAIIAIGTRANHILINSIPELKLNSWGYIDTDKTGRTNIPDIFAGGDIVTGSATVISAMGAGRVAADAIDEYINSTLSRS